MVKPYPDKPRWDLLPLGPVAAIVDVITWGAGEYAPDDWQDKNPDKFFAATFRHLSAWRLGERLDPESGLSHLAHAACNVIFLLWFELAGLLDVEERQGVDLAEHLAAHTEKVGAMPGEIRAVTVHDIAGSTQIDVECDPGNRAPGNGDAVAGDAWHIFDLEVAPEAGDLGHHEQLITLYESDGSVWRGRACLTLDTAANVLHLVGCGELVQTVAA